MSEELLTTTELGKRLRLSARTIQRYRHLGQLTPEMETPGGQARWLESSVRAQLRLIADKRRSND